MESNKLTTNIELQLGNFKKLPNYPFNKKGSFALFPGGENACLNEILYKALVNANTATNNRSFLASAHDFVKSKGASLINQTKLDWTSFNTFQELPLANEGFYMTGELLNWLGIFHYDDYIIIGGNDEFVAMVCNAVYGDSNWLVHFEKAYEEGDIAIYADQFDALKNSLLIKPTTP